MNDSQQLDKRKLFLLTLARLVVGLALIAGLLFLCAGTLDYWHTWLYIATLFLLLSVSFNWLIRKDPQLLERRMRTQEREKTQRWVIGISGVWLTLLYVLPGLDRRFHWSQVPLWLVLIGVGMVIMGYAFDMQVIHVNRFASRVVEVMQEQKVISSGPYTLVRHPMYLAILVFIFGTALALGSYWALIPAALMAPVLAVRLIAEEKTLRRSLPGYEEYTRRVRWRLIPGVW